MAVRLGGRRGEEMEMKGTMPSGTRAWRPRILVVVSVAAGVLVVASMAFACILRTGTLLVCSPASRTYTSGTQCSRAVGTGGQSGLARFSTEGSKISVKARNLGSKPYAILFRIPGSNATCTTHNNSTSISLLGLNADEQPNTVDGPRFYRSALATPASTATGRAQVCVIDRPEGLTAQTVNVVVI